MTDAPKKVYLDQDAEAGDGMFPRCFENPKYCSEPAVEYHRADLSRDLVRAALERAADAMRSKSDEWGDDDDMSDWCRPAQTLIAEVEAIAKDDEAVEAIITSVLGEPT